MRTLPKKLIAIENRDKGFQEKIDVDNLGNLPHSFRAILVSSPGQGKTSTTLQLLLHQNTPFDKIYLYHFDGDSKEYDLVQCEKVDELPPLENIDPTKKNCIIIEDILYAMLPKAQKYIFDRYFSYISSHRSLSIIVNLQNLFSVPPAIRRACTHLIIWNMKSDNRTIKDVAERSGGVDYKRIKELIAEHLKSRYDCLLFDFTAPPEYFIRFNIFDALKV